MSKQSSVYSLIAKDNLFFLYKGVTNGRFKEKGATLNYKCRFIFIFFKFQKIQTRIYIVNFKVFIKDDDNLVFSNHQLSISIYTFIFFLFPFIIFFLIKPNSCIIYVCKQKSTIYYCSGPRKPSFGAM